MATYQSPVVNYANTDLIKESVNMLPKQFFVKIWTKPCVGRTRSCTESCGNVQFCSTDYCNSHVTPVSQNTNGFAPFFTSQMCCLSKQSWWWILNDEPFISRTKWWYHPEWQEVARLRYRPRSTGKWWNCDVFNPEHYNDVIMGSMASQITSFTIVYLFIRT